MCLSVKALHSGVSVDQIHQLTAIDKWFLHKLHKITQLEQQLASYRGQLNTLSFLYFYISLVWAGLYLFFLSFKNLKPTQTGWSRLILEFNRVVIEQRAGRWQHVGIRQMLRVFVSQDQRLVETRGPGGGHINIRHRAGTLRNMTRTLTEHQRDYRRISGNDE